MGESSRAEDLQDDDELSDPSLDDYDEESP
jgi:hypothetical protein